MPGVALYELQMIGTAVFAVTGVLAVNRRGLDVFGAVVLGGVTSLGGGTIRDLVIAAPVFWLSDLNYVWVALIAALIGFFASRSFVSTYTLLLYLDGLGAALFAVVATEKVLGLGLGPVVAVIMGVLTSIGGGLVRDVLAGRQTLMMSREIYATPGTARMHAVRAASQSRRTPPGGWHRRRQSDLRDPRRRNPLAHRNAGMADKRSRRELRLGSMIDR